MGSAAAPAAVVLDHAAARDWARSAERTRARSRLRVARDVGQRLLHDAIDHDLLLGREPAALGVGVEHRARSACGAQKSSTRRCSAGNRPRSSSTGGRSRLLRSRTWASARADQLTRLASALEVELDLHRGQHLARLVVQLARDAPALVLLRAEQQSRELLELRAALTGARGVRRRAPGTAPESRW